MYTLSLFRKSGKYPLKISLSYILVKGSPRGPLVGIGITGVFISSLASGLARSRTSSTSEKEVKTILKLRLAKGEITKETYLDLQRLLSD